MWGIYVAVKHIKKTSMTNSGFVVVGSAWNFRMCKHNTAISPVIERPEVLRLVHAWWWWCRLVVLGWLVVHLLWWWCRLVLLGVGLPWVSSWCAQLLLDGEMLASEHVISLFKFQLMVLLLPDLANHAGGGAKEHDVSNALNNPSHISALMHDHGKHMANAREALHAIVEPDQLQIARVWDQIELAHQMKASARDGKTRTAAALATGADATSVAFAAHQTVAALLAAWREALAAKVFVPISNNLGTILESRTN